MAQNLNFGQHFLTDTKIIKNWIDISEINSFDKILEIGAGEGNITGGLAERGAEITAYEIDKQYLRQLTLLTKKYSNLKIVMEDALKHNWVEYTKIISNTPYFLSERIITKAIMEEIPVMTLIVGATLAEKLKGGEGRVGILVNMHYKIEFSQEVPKESFTPPPRSTSVLIKLTKKAEIRPEDQIITSILARRGKTKNAIIRALVDGGKTKREARATLYAMSLTSESLEKPTSKITKKMILRLKGGLVENT